MWVYFEINTKLDRTTTALVDAIANSFHTGRFLAVLFWSFAWLGTFVSFRSTALALRRGKWEKLGHPDRVAMLQPHTRTESFAGWMPGPSDACAFAGQQVCTATIAYVFNVIVGALVSFVLWFGPVRDLVVDWLPNLIPILIPVLITLICKKVFGYMWFANKFTIKHFRWWKITI